MAHVFACRARAATAVGLRRSVRGVAAAVVSLAFLPGAGARPAVAAQLPLVASELARMDLAALPGLPPAREANMGERNAAPLPSVAESRPAVPVKDRLTRFLDWLDSSEQDFQGVVMRRLSVPGSAGAPSVADAINRAATWSEAVASEAGQRFAALTDALSRHADKALGGIRLAQAGKPSAGAAPSGKPAASTTFGDTLAPVTDWLERSAQDFQSIIMRRLSVPSGSAVATPASQPSVAPAANGGDTKPATAPPAAAPAPSDGQRGIVDRMGEAAQVAKDWVTQSKRDFQERVVDKLTKPEAGAAQPPPAAAPAPKVASDNAAAKKAEDDARAAKQAVEAAERKVRGMRIDEQKAKEKADAESAAVKATAAAGQAENEAQRRKAAVEEAARKAAAEQKRADESTGEQKRLADEAARRKKAEADLFAKRAAEEAAQKKLDDARSKADEAARAAKQRENAARMAAEASRAADALLAVPKSKQPAGAAATIGAATSAPPSVAMEKREAGNAPKGKASCRAAGRRVKPPAVYVVARGDSLWVIARRHYKKGSRWVAIHKVNDDRIRNPDLIYPCQQFYIPRL